MICMHECARKCLVLPKQVETWFIGVALSGRGCSARQ